MSSQERSELLNQSFEVFSVEQGNGDDCEIFAMLNAYYVSLGINRPPIVPGTHVSKIYQAQLALCLLESDKSFL